jgi:hypothetical protein
MKFLLPLLLSLPALAGQNGPWQERWDSGEGLLEDTNAPTLARFGRTPADLCSTQVLRNGVQLPEQPELYHIRNPDEAWGTPEMIEAIVVAAEEMAWLMPSADPILIGDISRQSGGPLAPHRSHRSGIDADIGIYTTGALQPVSAGFAMITPSTIDYEANWLFWSELLATGLVDRILLDQSLINAMRAWAISSETLSRKEAYEIFPEAGDPDLWLKKGVFQHFPGHRDHIHLRVVCGEE